MISDREKAQLIKLGYPMIVVRPKPISSSDLKGEQTNSLEVPDFSHAHIESFYLHSPHAVANRFVILRECAAEYKTSVEAIKGKSLERSAAVPARHAAIYLLRTMGHKSYPAIGAIINRDHTSVLSAFRGVQDRLAGNALYAKRIEKIKRAIAVACANSGVSKWA